MADSSTVVIETYRKMFQMKIIRGTILVPQTSILSTEYSSLRHGKEKKSVTILFISIGLTVFFPVALIEQNNKVFDTNSIRFLIN